MRGARACRRVARAGVHDAGGGVRERGGGGGERGKGWGEVAEREVRLNPEHVEPELAYSRLWHEEAVPPRQQRRVFFHICGLMRGRV